MKRRTLTTIALLSTALTVWLVVYLCTRPHSNRLTVVSNGPLDIRLWGIRPDAGDFIYDPNGKVIQETLGIALSDPPYWGEEFQCFDFIFALPGDESMRFVSLPEIEVGGEGRHLGGSASQVFFDYQGRQLLWLRATLPRTFKRSVLGGLWRSASVFDAIDITVRYYHGSSAAPGFVLKGPFEPNSTLSSPDGTLEFSFKEYADRRSGRIAHIELRSPEYWNEREPIIIYDRSGSRHATIMRDIRPNSQSRRIEFSVHGMSLGQISAVAFEKSPRHITFRNVNLNVADRKRRSYPAYLDEMAERLGLSLTGKELAEYDFESEAQVLEVIDIVRGNVLVRAKNTLHRLCRGGRLAPNALTDEQARRLRHTLGRWLTAIDPLIRAFAVEIGLLCRWPEFVEPALQLLERPVRRGYESTRGAQYMAARALEGSAGELSDEQVRRIEDLLLDESRKDIHSSLRRVLKTRAAETRD